MNEQNTYTPSQITKILVDEIFLYKQPSVRAKGLIENLGNERVNTFIKWFISYADVDFTKFLVKIKKETPELNIDELTSIQQELDSLSTAVTTNISSKKKKSFDKEYNEAKKRFEKLEEQKRIFMEEEKEIEDLEEDLKEDLEEDIDTNE